MADRTNHSRKWKEYFSDPFALGLEQFSFYDDTAEIVDEENVAEDLNSYLVESSANVERVDFNYFDTASIDRYLTLLDKKTTRSLVECETEGLLLERARTCNRKTRILFVGPAGFREGIWDTRAKYIFPDLLEPLEDNDIYFLTGPVPDFANDAMQRLVEKFAITHYCASPATDCIRGVDFWTREIFRTSVDVLPDIITNIFGVTIFGPGMGIVAQRLNSHCVIRVAGDEVSSRVALGNYSSGSTQHVIDLKDEVLAYNLADRILVMSEREKSRVEDLSREVRGKAFIAQRGVDTDKFQPVENFASKRERLKFGFVGRRSAEKGFDVVERSAALLESRDRRVKFSFAGSFSPGQEGNIVYYGFVQSEDLPVFYSQIDCLILCSRNEGFPQVVMEAMAMGIPCILSKHIFEDEFEDGKDAFLTDLVPEKVASIIRRVAYDSESSNRVASRSREIALSRFDQLKGRKRYKELLLGGH